MTFIFRSNQPPFNSVIVRLYSRYTYVVLKGTLYLCGQLEEQLFVKTFLILQVQLERGEEYSIFVNDRVVEL